VAVEAGLSSAVQVECSDEGIVRTKDAELQVQRIRPEVQACLYSPQRRLAEEIGAGGRELSEILVRIAALIADNQQQEERLLQISDLSIKPEDRAQTARF
jgi:hypothetical protein